MATPCPEIYILNNDDDEQQQTNSNLFDPSGTYNFTLSPGDFEPISVDLYIYQDSDADSQSQADYRADVWIRFLDSDGIEQRTQVGTGILNLTSENSLTFQVGDEAPIQLDTGEELIDGIWQGLQLADPPALRKGMGRRPLGAAETKRLQQDYETGLSLLSQLQTAIGTIPQEVEGVSFEGIRSSATRLAMAYKGKLETYAAYLPDPDLNPDLDTDTKNKKGNKGLYKASGGGPSQDTGCSSILASQPSEGSLRRRCNNGDEKACKKLVELYLSPRCRNLDGRYSDRLSREACDELSRICARRIQVGIRYGQPVYLGCGRDAAKCTNDVLDSIQAQKDAVCKGNNCNTEPDNRRASDGNDCETVAQNLARAIVCQALRRREAIDCFDNRPDPGHQTQLNQVANTIRICRGNLNYRRYDTVNNDGTLISVLLRDFPCPDFYLRDAWARWPLP